MSRRTVIAIDGPSASGKSTVARRVADRLGFRFLDSGAMYRALALAALRAGTAGGDEAGLVRLLGRSGIALDGDRVLLDGEDVSEEIRSPEVTRRVSEVAAAPGVRAGMVEKQRAAFPGRDMVVEGRDIGSVVFPDAALKIFLTADARERARRRARQTGREVETVLAEQEERDERDRRRDHSPLVVAEDAALVDCTGLSVEEVVEVLVARISRELGS